MLLCCGDFIFHLSKKYPGLMVSLYHLSEFGLYQSVSLATHNKDNNLDLIKAAERLDISGVEIVNSDLNIIFSVITTVTRPKHIVSDRNLKDLKLPLFTENCTAMFEKYDKDERFADFLKPSVKADPRAVVQKCFYGNITVSLMIPN